MRKEQETLGWVPGHAPPILRKQSLGILTGGVKQGRLGHGFKGGVGASVFLFDLGSKQLL